MRLPIQSTRVILDAIGKIFRHTTNKIDHLYTLVVWMQMSVADNINVETS
jgi:hypothetical protein